MRLDQLFENLKFADAKNFVADLEFQTGRIREIAEREPWLCEFSQRDIEQKHGSVISVFRALTLTSPLRSETVVSTSLDIEPCLDMLILSPELIWGKTMNSTKKKILHYRIPSDRVVIWVPSALQHVKQAIGKRTNYRVEDRHGELLSMDYILRRYDELNENEVIADVTGIKPRIMDYEYNTGRIISALLRGGKVHPLVEQLPNYTEVVEKFRKFVK